MRILFVCFFTVFILIWILFLAVMLRWGGGRCATLLPTLHYTHYPSTSTLHYTTLPVPSPYFKYSQHTTYIYAIAAGGTTGSEAPFNLSQLPAHPDRSSTARQLHVTSLLYNHHRAFPRPREKGKKSSKKRVDWAHYIAVSQRLLWSALRRRTPSSSAADRCHHPCVRPSI